MSSTKEYRDYILDELNILDNITYKPMMGEYLLYHNGLLFGGVYDDRFLVKETKNNNKYNMEEVIPYEKSKPMYLVAEENKEIIKEIILDTCEGLKKEN